jgi:hypothetical protein
MKQNYPKTRAAVRALELDQWKLGDALIEECGKPGEDSSHNGSFAKLAEAAWLIRGDGYPDYDPETLRKYRDMSDRYPPGTRIPGVSWTVHRVVHDSVVLARIVEGLPAGERLTVETARTMLKLIRREAEAEDEARSKQAEARWQQEAAERLTAAEAELEAAQAREAAALDAVQHAEDAAARSEALAQLAAAKAEIADAQHAKHAAQLPPPMPTGPLPYVPPVERIPGHILSSEVLIKTGELRQDVKHYADGILEVIRARGTELAQVSIAAVVTDIVEAQNTLTALLEEVQRGRKPRSHLMVVGKN